MEPEPRLPRSARLVLALAALVLLLAAAPRPNGWTDASLLATAESLAERGTLAIDDSALLWQGARVRVGGRWYSSEPPVLGLLAAVPGRLVPSIATAGAARALTWALVGLPVWLGLWATGHLALAAGLRGRSSALAIAALAFTTPLLPYGLVLNPHAPAAGFAIAALLALARGRPMGAGAAAGLAAALHPLALIALVAGAWPAARLGGARGLARYALGALPPLALAAGLSAAVFGDALPAGAHPETLDYPLSPAALEVEVSHVERAVGAALGAAGWLRLHPLMALALVLGLASRARRAPRDPGSLPAPIADAALVTALATLIWASLQPLAPEPPAFGDRRLCLAAPMAVLGGALWLGARCRRGLHVPAFARAGAGLLALASLATAVTGAAGPWTRFELRADSTGAAAPGATGAAASGPSDAAAPGPTDAAAPGPLERARREWLRVRSARLEYTSVGYDRTYRELLARLADDALAGRVPAAAARETLRAISAELERLGHTSECRWAVHYELGRVHEHLGELELARREYERTAFLYPRHGPAREAAERLARRPRGSAEPN